jgi:hypothetical protein
MTSVVLDRESLIVKPDAAKKQKDEDVGVDTGEEGKIKTGVEAGTGEDAGEEIIEEAKLRRFYGSAKLDEMRLGRDAGRIAEEIVQHLSVLEGSQVEVTLDIQAKIPQGAPDDVVRTVTENCNTLNFETHGFEKE